LDSLVRAREAKMSRMMPLRSTILHGIRALEVRPDGKVVVEDHQPDAVLTDEPEISSTCRAR